MTKMNIEGTLQQLYAERERIKRAIATCEDLQSATNHGKKRRGRKSMGAQERQEVSVRIKKYWADRRRAKNQPGGPKSRATGA